MRAVLRTAAALLLALGSAGAARAQEPAGGPPPSDAFFSDETPIALTLTANFDALRRDREESPAWRPATLTYSRADGTQATIPLRLRPRGIWRRKNCQMPPLRLDFQRGQVAGTPFEGLDRPKLVNFCQDQERGEQYVLQELQLYRVYHALTPMSHRVRLLRITYVDSASGRVRTTRHGFVIEETRDMARRVGAGAMDLVSTAPDWLDARTRTLVGVFQYFIGNHDWSIGGMHNVEVIGRDSVLYPVPYDFDYAGAVNAHYAVPPPQVPVRSVRQRYFRGDCAPDEMYEEVFSLFRDRRAAIQALYEDRIGKLMSRSTASATLAYFDDFYETIANRGAVRRLITSRCGPQ